MVINFCDVAPTNSETIHYIEKKNRDGSTIFIAQAAEKIKIDFDIVKNTSNARKVANYIKVSDVNIITPTTYADLAAQTTATTNGQITQNSTTKDVVMKDQSGDTIIISGSLKKFRITQPLVAGNNTITDNLNLLTPFARIVSVRDAVTGSEIAGRLINETANTYVFNVPVAVASATLTSL